MASKILNDGAVSQLIFALKPLSSDLSLIFYLLSGDFHTPSNLNEFVSEDGEVNSVTHMFRLSPRLSSMLLYAGKDCTSVTNMSIIHYTKHNMVKQ
ncbi:BnaC05g30600D [Brassica napus]|uniref:BnaC05g30600D protein n=1 Tax=Brassica napus TaxID=3708 RepID=A0A078I597_BRANA|nr:BnaC05g30600D [Brassica napus]